MRAVIVGPGRIGCGFAGQVLHESGFELVFLARDPQMVGHLSRVRGYRVSLSDGRRTREIGIAGVSAIGTSAAASSRTARFVSNVPMAETPAIPITRASRPTASLLWAMSPSWPAL